MGLDCRGIHAKRHSVFQDQSANAIRQGLIVDDSLMGCILLACFAAFFYFFGYAKAHSEVAQECQRLGAFYVGDKTYSCKVQPAQN